MWRRRLVGFGALVLLAFSAVSIPAAPACACSCAVLDEAQSTAQAELVFDGTVQRIGKPAPWSDGDLTVAFTVESVVKGRAAERVTLSTATDSAACGYAFVVGGRYRVFARDGRTNLCDGNRELPAAPAPTGSAAGQPGPGAGGPGQPTAGRPAAGGSGVGWPVIGVGAGLTVAVALTGGLWLLRRARRWPTGGAGPQLPQKSA